jgi:hypothetical protein
MTAPLREQLKNDAATTLNGAINNSVTSVVVTDGSVFPSVGNFRILVESEIMLCTARSSNTLTVLRGQEGTTAASHGDGLGVLHTLTAGSHTRIIQDNDTRNTSQPPLGVIDNGSGGLLTSSDFTWDNQGGATVSDENGTILLAVHRPLWRELSRTLPDGSKRTLHRDRWIPSAHSTKLTAYPTGVWCSERTATRSYMPAGSLRTRSVRVASRCTTLTVLHRSRPHNTVGKIARS